MTSAFRGV